MKNLKFYSINKNIWINWMGRVGHNKEELLGGVNGDLIRT